MTKQPEKLLVLKERYLRITDYDVLKAEMLYLVETMSEHGQKWVQCAYKDIENYLLMPASVRSVERKMKQLEDDGWIEVERSRPNKYRVNAEQLEKAFAEYNLLGVHGYLLPIESLSHSNSVLVHEDAYSVVTEETPKHDNLSGLRPRVSRQIPTENRRKIRAKATSKAKKVFQIPTPTENEVISTPETRQVGGFETEGKPNKKDNNDIILTNTSVNPDVTSTDVTLKNNTDVTSGELTQVLDQSNLPSTSINNLAIGDEKPKTPRKRKKGEKKPKKNRYYDWTHYAKFSTEEWKLARQEGKWPGKETGLTLLLGAYLLAMKRKHGVETGLTPGDFNGKYGTLSKKMLEFFTDQHGGDELKGFNAGLDWIREFVYAPADSFVGKAGWPLQMAFSRDMYRQHGTGQFLPKTGKKRNDTGNVIMTQEQREEAMKKVRIGRG